MGLLEKAMAAATEAAIKAKETAEELQVRKDLWQAYQDLGKRTFELVERGEIPAAGLEPLAEKVRTLKAQLDTAEPAGAAAAASPPEEERHEPEPPGTPTV